MGAWRPFTEPLTVSAEFMLSKFSNFSLKTLVLIHFMKSFFN